AVLAQRLVETDLEVGRFAPPADDQCAGEVIRTGSEIPRTGAGNHDRARWHRAAMLPWFRPRHVDHRNARGERHIRAEHGARADAHAFGEDAPRADECSVFDDHWSRSRRLE